jgi:hypothetical protein
VGYSGIENKEKLNFQTQRLGESMAKDLSSLVEERPGDALYRGERFTKDFYRDISNTQALLKADAARTASGKNLLTEKQRGIANKRIQNMLERDVTWQMSRKDVLFAKERSLETAGMAKEPSPEATAEFIGGLPEDKIAPTGPVKISGRAIMEIGLENLYNVKTVQGNELGVISTGAAPTKKLSEMGKASTRTPQEWLDYRAGINPFTGQHAIPEETSLGSLRSGRVQGASFRTLAEAAEQEGLGKPSSTADRVKQWAEKTGEQPARGYAEPAKDTFEEEFLVPSKPRRVSEELPTARVYETPLKKANFEQIGRAHV